MKCNEINIRDPYILVHDGKYYLYGTRSETAFVGQAFGFDVYVSDDLIEFEGPIEVFHRPENFFSKKSYWAPEVYFYENKFYMFATFAGEKGKLGTAALIADKPIGPFQLWSDGFITPDTDRCLDGTLYIAGNKTPYMIYCHEWRQIHDGTICAVELSKDLKKRVKNPVVLFSASQGMPYVKKYFFRNYVTDGPYMIRTDDGRLHMIWSTNAHTGYVEALAHSDTNEIDGKWKPDEKLLYSHDGGHGMIFKDLKGEYNMVLHYPNTFGKEHPKFIPLKYIKGEWKLHSQNEEKE